MSNEIVLDYEPNGNDGTVKIIVRDDKNILMVDKLDIASAQARDRFQERLVNQYPGFSPADVMSRLNEIAVEAVEPKKSEALAWEPPIPFGQYDLPAFPLEAIPDELCALREYCAAVAESFQVPADLPGMLVLSVGATALAKKIEVGVRDDWWEPVNLYVAVAMEPGERKSAVFKAVSKPVAEFEKQENERLAPLITENRVALATLTAEMKHAQTKAAKAEKEEARQAARHRVSELAEEIRTTKIIVPCQIVADDATPEAVGQLLFEQEGRIALLSPEGDVFDLMGGRYSDGVSRLGVYLKGHAGDDHRLNRVGRPTEYVHRPAITVGLTVQPDVLRGLTEKPGFRGRGLLGRFLYSLPVSRVGYRNLNSIPVPAIVSANYTHLVRMALQLKSAVDSNGHPYPHLVHVNADALAELDRFRGWAETELRQGGGLSANKDWGSKLPGAVCRIAGIFHGLIFASTGRPAAQSISPETMLSAIAIGEYTVEHAKAAFCEMGANPTTGVARRILAWMIEGRLSEFSRRDAFNAVRGTVQRVDELDEPLQLLSDHAYIRERSTERKGPGRKPSNRYDVNPLAYAQNSRNAQNSGASINSAKSAYCAQGAQS